ncbi:DUF3810 domain-containing protein [Algibacter sp. AS12]|uniref:DUF3810 domain-containing protein n=1 Tax=Algibacter sp. AS12 TaxID=3135773 RepID=UPI00398B6344
MLKQKKTLIALSLIPQVLLVKLAANYPDVIERYYSTGLYPVISKIFRFTLGWLPFSFGDLLYTFASIYMLRWFYKNRKRLRQDTKNWVIDVFAAVAFVYMAFHLFWGLNYYRLPLHKSLNLEHDYTTEQLAKVTKSLIEKANALHFEITKNDTLKAEIKLSKSAIFEMVPAGYANLKKQFPDLNYSPTSLKKSIYSYPLTYMGFSGYLNPLTNEAQVDGLIPVFKFSTTSAHEVAHQLGFAAENEANFIAFMATTNHDNVYFKYSGYTFALRFCLNEIYRRDEALYEDIICSVNTGILKNYKEVRDFWEAHKNPIEPYFKSFYGNFLKANRQHKGMQSYNYVVALIVNYLENTPE